MDEQQAKHQEPSTPPEQQLALEELSPDERLQVAAVLLQS
jgi:hypothetical protein